MERTIDQRLRAMLLMGIVCFTYEKTDKTMRQAFGTTKEGLVPKFTEQQALNLKEALSNTGDALQRIIEKPEMAQDKEGFAGILTMAGDALKPFEPKERIEKEPNLAVVTYYDLEAQGWRSCKVENIREILSSEAA